MALTGVAPAPRDELKAMGLEGHEVGGAWIVDVEGDAKTRDRLTKALAAGANVDALTPKRETLEAIFVRKAL